MNKPNTLRKDYDARLDDVAPKARTAIFVITTDAVDRDREVVVPSGLDLKNYLRNPIVPAVHDQNRWPVGKSQWIKPYNRDRELRALVRFAESREAEEVWQLVKDDFVNGASIGFNPDYSASGPPTDSEIREKGYWKDARTIYRKAELLEWSIVPLPCNPEALKVAVSKGIKLPSFYVPNTPTPTEAVMEPSETTAVDKASTESSGASGGYGTEDGHVKVGDHVAWKHKGGGWGVVKSLHKSGKAPHTDESEEGSEDDPVARVKVYKQMNDGYEETSQHKGIKCSKCVKLEDDYLFQKKAIIVPVYRTMAQVEASMILALKSKLSAEQIAVDRTAAELNRLRGVI